MWRQGRGLGREHADEGGDKKTVLAYIHTVLNELSRVIEGV